MTLRPDFEALVQGALDGSLSPEDRGTLDRLLSTDPDVRARAAELRQLSALIESLGQVDAPPTFAADVLAAINNSARSSRVFEFSRATPPVRAQDRRSPSAVMAMNAKVIWGLAAAAVLVLAVVGYIANPSVNQGTEATIGTAQRYQAPQIDSRDVAVGDTSVQLLLQSETWAAIVKDETLLTLLQDANFRAKLQEPELRRALRDPELAKKLTDPQLQAALARPGLKAALEDPGFAAAIAHPQFGEAMNQLSVPKLQDKTSPK